MGEASLPAPIGLGIAVNNLNDYSCERCGLAHFFTDGPVTLALFRYKAQEAPDARSDAGKG